MAMFCSPEQRDHGAKKIDRQVREFIRVFASAPVIQGFILLRRFVAVVAACSTDIRGWREK